MRITTALAASTLALLSACSALQAVRVQTDPAVQAHVAAVERAPEGLVLTLHGAALANPSARRLHVVALDEAGAPVAEADVTARLVHDGRPGAGPDRARAVLADAGQARSLAITPAR